MSKKEKIIAEGALTIEIQKKLIGLAKGARIHAYAKYSHFKVGAALLCRNGNVYTGFNIENSSYSATICAERVAFSCAIANGEKDFTAIAVVGGNGIGIDKKNFASRSDAEADTVKAITPCGVCRQFMSEFCDDGFTVITLSDDEENPTVYTLSELLPHSFRL
ncbi:MAG: cytidine deaminase [Eubacteriales bacterium]|nr:cytidine deaminase [Eubacteriales bacterium]